MPRGGRRTGTPGQQYANRSDLAQSKLPVKVVTNQPYGEAGQQQAAQQAIPMASPPAPGQGLAPPPSAAPPQAPQGPGQPAPPQNALTQGVQGPLPGQLTPLTAPTQRPSEPLTTGIASGAGAGPEVLGNFQRNGNLASTLDQLARASGNSDLQVLAQRAMQLGQ